MGVEGKNQRNKAWELVLGGKLGNCCIGGAAWCGFRAEAALSSTLNWRALQSFPHLRTVTLFFLTGLVIECVLVKCNRPLEPCGSSRGLFRCMQKSLECNCAPF